MRSGAELVPVRWRTADTEALRLLVVEWWLSARLSAAKGVTGITSSPDVVLPLNTGDAIAYGWPSAW